MAGPKLTAYPFALLLLSLILTHSATAEIYKWVDKSGRVHFSDKKHADENAKRLDEEPEINAANANHLKIYPDADALLSENRSNATQGNTRVLSAGALSSGELSAQNTSVLHFDLTNLLTAVHGGGGKRVVSAQLKLTVNTDDDIYSLGKNREGAGSNNENAFFLMPTRNNWEEATVTWGNFYSSTQYVPSTIRKLPSISVESSKEGLQHYSVDVRELLDQVVQGNLRELSLEMKLQRLQSGSHVTIHSREADIDSRPVLVIDLIESPKTPTPTTP